jgi:hypothetical protein
MRSLEYFQNIKVVLFCPTLRLGSIGDTFGKVRNPFAFIWPVNSVYHRVHKHVRMMRVSVDRSSVRIFGN